ncbi:MAG: lamin tail domain-containing protein, partial [Verrucomicrobia bacterium]|nr:lamin tail domain-containing protein [Verrucomicrobiota bacterium]
MTWKQLCCILVFGACVVVAQARVVINEVLYNAPGDYDSLQFVEVANQGREPVELGGWFFSKGIRHVFPPGSVLKPGGFIVLASDAVLFQEVYGSLPTAVFKGLIRKEGEELEISDASGRPMDRVVFSDRHPWPVAADGFSASLERISPDTPGDLRDNWEASSLSAQPGRPGGTPGATNGVFSTNLPPRLSLLTLLPSTSKPGAQLPIECEVSDRDGIDSVTLVHSRARSGSAGEEERTPMVQGAPGVFQARLLIGKETGAIHRVYFEARDRLGAVRRLPGASEPRPAFSIWASEDTPSLTVPIIHLIQTSKPEMERLQKSRVQGGGPGAFAGRRG